MLIPGVIESKSNFIEHPELIAQRIGRYAKLVGRENVIAGSDCGYGTWVGQAAVDPDVVFAKLAAMAEGARDRHASSSGIKSMIASSGNMPVRFRGRDNLERSYFRLHQPVRPRGSGDPAFGQRTRPPHPRGRTEYVSTNNNHDAARRRPIAPRPHP